MPDAIEHLLPESRKPSGKQRRYCLIRCTFWGNQFFFLLAKKIVPVKPRWTSNVPFTPPYRKVQFLGNRRGGMLISSPDFWKKPLLPVCCSRLFTPHGVVRPTLNLQYVQYCFAQCLSCALPMEDDPMEIESNVKENGLSCIRYIKLVLKQAIS